MNAFELVQARSVRHAIELLAGDQGTRIIAGGTNLLDLMKENVARPDRLVDVTRLPLDAIEETGDGGLRIGALVSNTDVAYDAKVRQRFPLLSSAILAGASPQLRNMASTGGNLLQRTRCYYFYDLATACNKREPGSGCSAIGGVNRDPRDPGRERAMHRHPPFRHVRSPRRARSRRLRRRALGRTPHTVRAVSPIAGDTPHLDTNLAPHEIIVAVEVPPNGFADNHTYIKIRDRSSYAFALVSVAAALEMDGATVKKARIAMGGVSHRPWRDSEAEAALAGVAADQANFEKAADLMLRDAVPQSGNGFKIELARRAIVRALGQAAAGTPQVQSDKTFS